MIDAPNLAIIANALRERPFSDGPYEVSGELYLLAEHEMEAVMRDRGFALAAANIGRTNFLLFGVPICPVEH